MPWNLKAYRQLMNQLIKWSRSLQDRGESCASYTSDRGGVFRIYTNPLKWQTIKKKPNYPVTRNKNDCEMLKLKNSSAFTALGVCKL